MQSPNENGKQQSTADSGPARDTELSEAWRALLGSQLPSVPSGTPSDLAAQVQPLASDPWSLLLNAQGMETVDLQKIHLHALHPATNDDDVEHALNLMREATGQLTSQEEKPREG